MNKYGVLVISHGSRSGEWVRLVDQAVDAVPLPPGVPIVSAFLEIVEGRLIQDGIRGLEEQGVTDIIAVPLFVSSGSTHVDEISYALGVIPEPALPTDLGLMDVRARIHWCSPIDDDPDIAGVLYEKIKGLSAHPDQEIIMLVGHGSDEAGFHEKWRKGLGSLAGRVQKLGGFAEADAAMLLPDQLRVQMAMWRERKPDHDVLVVPVFLSEGYFTEQVIPSRLEGFIYKYNGAALLPSPRISRWMEKQIESALQIILQ